MQWNIREFYIKFKLICRLTRLKCHVEQLGTYSRVHVCRRHDRHIHTTSMIPTSRVSYNAGSIIETEGEEDSDSDSKTSSDSEEA
jgi:hypothetical protein